MKTTADYLWSTAQYLRKHGWLNKGLGKVGGPRCALGALATVQGTIQEYNAAADALREEIGEPFIARWNDKQTDAEVVITTIERVAKRLERK